MKEKIKNALANHTGKGVFGTVTGVINGLFGAGGGSLLVPVFTLWGLDQKKAQATALGLTLPMTAVTVFGYGLWQGVPQGAWLAAAGALAGGLVGGLMLNQVKGIWLSRVFYGLMFLGGAAMLL